MGGIFLKLIKLNDEFRILATYLVNFLPKVFSLEPHNPFVHIQPSEI